MRWPAALSCLLALAACGEVAGPVPLQRLWLAQETLTGLPPAGAVEVEGEGRPGWSLPSGQAVHLSLEVPRARPCWLQLDLAPTQGGPMTVVVRAGDRTLRQTRMEREPRPAAGPFRELGLDLAPFQGQALDLQLTLESGHGEVLITRPRLVAQEAFDLRGLEVVLLWVPADSLAQAATALVPVLGPWQERPWAEAAGQPPGPGRGVGLRERLAAGHRVRDREWFVWTGAGEPLRADAWFRVDPWAPGPGNPGRRERLLAMAGRSRPHPVTLWVETRADPADLAREVGHLRRRLGARDGRTLWVLGALDAPAGGPLRLRPPRPRSGVLRTSSSPVRDLAVSLLQAMDQAAGRGGGPIAGDEPLDPGS